MECVDVADSLGSDIIRKLVGGGSDRWKSSVQEGGDGVVLGRVDLDSGNAKCQELGQSPKEVSKQDVEVNKFYVVGDDGGFDEAFAIHRSDVCCNKAASYKPGEAGAEYSAYL